MSKRILAILALATCVAILGLLVVNSGRGDDGKNAASGRMVKAWLEIRPAPPSAFKPGGKFDQAEFDFTKRRIAAYVKCPVVLKAVLDDAAVQQLAAFKNVPPDDRMRFLDGALVVEFPGDLSLMTIAMPDDANHDAATIVDAVANGLLNTVVIRERTEKLSRRDQLYKKLQMYEKQVGQKENALHGLRTQFDEERQIATSNTDQLSADLNALSDEIRELKKIVTEMDQTLTQWNIEIDAPSRVAKIADASR